MGVVILVGVAGMMSVLLFGILCRLPADQSFARTVRAGINGHDYGRLSARLLKSGMADKITPPVYRLVQGILFLAGYGAAVCTGGSWGICLLLGGLSAVVPGVMLRLHIKKENQRMLPDIEHLYHLLHLQHQAGAFVLDSLIDSYRVVTYPRLKKALIDLAGAIGNKKPVRQAAEEFAGKFDNPYLTTLADIVKHSVEDGSTDTMLADVTEQLAGIQQAQYVLEEGRQQMKGVLICSLLFAGIVAGMLLIGIEALSASGEALLL